MSNVSSWILFRCLHQIELYERGEEEEVANKCLLISNSLQISFFSLRRNFLIASLPFAFFNSLSNYWIESQRNDLMAQIDYFFYQLVAQGKVVSARKASEPFDKSLSSNKFITYDDEMEGWKYLLGYCRLQKWMTDRWHRIDVIG